VGRAVVAAATDKRPKLRYPAGSLARRVSKARRYVPAAIFDKQIRKINQLNRPASTTVSSPERKTSNAQPMSHQAPQAGPHRKQAGGEGL
jgi:predicted kinase